LFCYSFALLLKMTTPEEMRKTIWDGLLPVVFNLSPNEVTTFQPPLPFYMTLPRVSYLPIVCGPVRDHFMLYAPSVIDEMWFDFNGIPLKWHHPIGVLFDLLTTQTDLPWPLTVHFQEFPSASLLRCASEEIVKSQFTNTLKEANFIKHGDAGKVNSLSVLESEALWIGLRTYDFDMFWSSNKLLGAPINCMKYVPIRVIQEKLPFIQDLVLPRDENGNERTLSSVLYQLLFQFKPPQISSPQLDTQNPSQEPEGQTAGEGGSNNNNLAISTAPKLPVLSAWLQGIELPLESTVVWLYDRFSYPDNFLYLVVQIKKK